ncbi:MAG TPA: 23S rRNA (adenine(2030)-N(6))-methyltransferase RlmJ [Burkholderiaceae bacterium]|nr:23S rRNA (adenine(2030)-N(6))-methyltransferase RlmJ [Burkholderiaceae bacterium]
MNYRHLYHAGNFADVFKHVALMLLLRAFHKKETPFCYVDTHAGAGRYDLTTAPAQRSGEYRDGIARLWDTALSDALADYLTAIRALNPDGRLRMYPGSPLIARSVLRPQDRMLLCEKHPEECAQLRAEFAGDRQVAAHERDGYEALKALLPPAERRGLVLIDPPYEQPDEFEQIVAGLATARERWATGVYAVWYPIKDRRAVADFHERLRASGWGKLLVAELTVFPEDTAFRLNGCGLAVVNPPWGFDDSLALVLPELRQRLARDPAAGASVQWLASE